MILCFRFQSYPIEDILSCDYLFDRWEPLLIEQFLDYLRPDNMQWVFCIANRNFSYIIVVMKLFRIVVVSKSFEEIADQIERWYGTKYTVETIPRDLIEVWILWIKWIFSWKIEKSDPHYFEDNLAFLLIEGMENDKTVDWIQASSTKWIYTSKFRSLPVDWKCESLKYFMSEIWVESLNTSTFSFMIRNPNIRMFFTSHRYLDFSSNKTTNSNSRSSVFASNCLGNEFLLIRNFSNLMRRENLKRLFCNFLNYSNIMRT